ncbi:MAG: ribonuclease H-like domain-containing protein [Spirochaetes bacterium]|nr:ribonuclease H-like domain-containing protein [Spirochaetota bacterium]MBU1079280.1 ribonuclease H-like domain-containing protein [Spirochaetota bacterium]
MATRRRASDSEFPPGWTTVGEGLRLKETIASGLGVRSDERVRLAAFSARMEDRSAAAGGMLFFDLETTGLSGGAGTVAFLAAVGSVLSDGSFRVRQYFIDDYPSEPRLIESLEAEFQSAEAVVTYNGSSFDMPLYSVRRSMNGFGPMPQVAHVDALHASRRLWRRVLGDCSLGSVEAAALGVRRSGDIPGREIPECWFEYLRRGECGRLGAVFSHNELDVRSLAALTFMIHGAAAGRGGIMPCDLVGLADLQSRLDEGLAEGTLRRALDSGDARAARPLMRLYRKQGRFEERIALVGDLPDDAAGLFSKSVYAERVTGDIVEALRLAVAARDAARGSLLDRAERRAIRLRRRLGEAEGR